VALRIKYEVVVHVSDVTLMLTTLTNHLQTDDCIHSACFLKVDTTAVVTGVRQSDRIHMQECRTIVNIKIRPACEMR
jgi:intracellular sulfur oxidation DsrE/DsrF family protein